MLRYFSDGNVLWSVFMDAPVLGWESEKVCLEGQAESNVLMQGAESS